MYNNSEILQIVKEQLALEYHCRPEDLAGRDNLVTTVVNAPERRKFAPEPSFLSMVTWGQNAVITTDSALHPWLAEFVADKAGHWLFEYENLSQINAALAPYGKKIRGTFHMFLPLKAVATGAERPGDWAMRWYEGAEIHPLYADGRFRNALCDSFLPERPDVLAVAAVQGDEIIGMAGCSADTPLLWQIGIDVVPGHRGKGLGTALVLALKNEILRRGKIPYYGTSLSNLHSWHIALNCGFVPSWVETAT